MTNAPEQNSSQPVSANGLMAKGALKAPFASPYVYRAARSGMSLIELLVVILIMTVMTTGIVPLFMQNSQGVRLKDNVERIGGLIHYCRDMAVFQSAIFRLHIDPVLNMCRVEYERDPLEEPGVFYPYMASEYSSMKFHDGIRLTDLYIDSGQAEGWEAGEFELMALRETEEEDEGTFIEFHRDGTADDSKLLMTNKDSEFFLLELNGMTGSTKVKQISPIQVANLLWRDETTSVGDAILPDGSEASTSDNDTGDTVEITQ